MKHFNFQSKNQSHHQWQNSPLLLRKAKIYKFMKMLLFSMYNLSLFWSSSKYRHVLNFDNSDYWKSNSALYHILMYHANLFSSNFLCIHFEPNTQVTLMWYQSSHKESALIISSYWEPWPVSIFLHQIWYCLPNGVILNFWCLSNQ